MNSPDKVEASFEVVRGPTSWFVVVTRRNGSKEQLGGFDSEQEAYNWIKDKSPGWLGNPPTK